jgi:hypothetical protein
MGAVPLKSLFSYLKQRNRRFVCRLVLELYCNTLFSSASPGRITAVSLLIYF